MPTDPNPKPPFDPTGNPIPPKNPPPQPAAKPITDEQAREYQKSHGRP